MTTKSLFFATIAVCAFHVAITAPVLWLTIVYLAFFLFCLCMIFVFGKDTEETVSVTTVSVTGDFDQQEFAQRVRKVLDNETRKTP